MGRRHKKIKQKNRWKGCSWATEKNVRFLLVIRIGATENAGQENDGQKNDGQKCNTQNALIDH